MPAPKDLIFLASSAKDLGKLPQSAQDGLADAFDALTIGSEPDDFKALRGFDGVWEIRLRDRGNAYRAAYVARFPEAIYVLHVWQKKSEKTARPDLDLIRSRFKTLIQRRE